MIGSLYLPLKDPINTSRVLQAFLSLWMSKYMETNRCDVNHTDAGSLLPPRKRLLAGLKRQNSDVNSLAPSTPNSICSKYDERRYSLVKSRLNNPNLSYEEIVEASKTAAIEAAKIAVAARENAEEKAAKAAKAVAAAKNALELVCIVSEENSLAEKYVRKNKLKKHRPVTTLYNGSKDNADNRTDEELARMLHQAINSSPRILKNSADTDAKNHKQKRLKSSEKARDDNNSPVVETDKSTTATGNDNLVLGEVDTGGPVNNTDMMMIDLNASNPNEGHQLKFDGGKVAQPNKDDDQPNTEYGETKTFQSKEKNGETLDSFSRKRGRPKQKKLPLSIFSFSDQTGSGKELQDRTSPPLKDNDLADQSSPVGPSVRSLMPTGSTSLWKCQSMKAPTTVKRNKTMQS